MTEKPGCTSRAYDLPGKSLNDFVIAGINSAPYVAKLLTDRGGGTRVFHYGPEALKSSNRHKNAKYINFGLLEIMFPVVKGRLACDKEDAVIDRIVEIIRTADEKDVAALQETRRIAWTTSDKPHKVGFDYAKYAACGTVGRFYDLLYEDFPAGVSNHEWALQYKEDLPILRAFFEAYRSTGDITTVTTEVFLAQQKRYPKAAVGILADMCAAALFLHLSFQE